MPANKKYLSSPGQRVLKVSAALLGGYMVTASFHLFLMQFVNKKDLYISMHFTTWMLWAVLMVVAFLAKSGWKIWGLYLFISLAFFSPFLYQYFKW